MVDVINKLYELDEEELTRYVRNRVIDLEVSTNPFSTLPYIQKGFISKKTMIKASDADIMGYSMDGVDYLEFVEYLRSRDIGRDIISLLVQTGRYVSNYFDYNVYYPYKDLRGQILIEEVSKEIGSDDILDIISSNFIPSINCLRTCHQAVCLEHSVLMQNLLTFLGFDVTCYLMIGLTDGKISGHAVNVIDIEIDGEVKHLYYDLVNMEVVQDEGKDVLSPTMKLISEEDYQMFLTGEKPLCIERVNSHCESGKIRTFYLPKTLQNISTLNKMKK